MARHVSLHSLQAKFLAIAVPLVLVSTFGLFAVIQINAERAATREFQDKLEKLATMASTYIAPTLWNVQKQNYPVILTPMSINPDVLGAILYEEEDVIVARIGTMEARAPPRAPGRTNDANVYRLEIPIWSPQEPNWQIGRLAVALTDKRVQVDTRNRKILAAQIGGLLVFAIVLSVMIAHRRAIGIPLNRLLDAIHAAQEHNVRKAVEWPSRDEMGEVISAFNAMQARQATYEAELRAARETARTRLTDAIETISEGFSLYDSDDRLVLCNTQYRESVYPGIGDIVIPGTSFETIARTAAERGLLKDANGRVDEWLAERLARHTNPSGPHQQESNDGRWILVNEKRTDGGGTVAVYTDITKLKRAEEAKSDFLRQVEHDSNNLLQRVIGFIGLVKQNSGRLLDGTQSQNLDKALISAKELRDVIWEIERHLNGLPPQPENVHLGPLLDECLSFVEVELQLKKKVALARKIEPELPLLWVDSLMLKRIVANFLSNAVKCTPKGSIEISARRVDEHIAIAVKDTGYGIDEQHLERIFDKGVKLSPDRPGSGLGLTICKDFADRIGGTISVESTLGEGSTFTVTIPLRYSAP